MNPITRTVRGGATLAFCLALGACASDSEESGGQGAGTTPAPAAAAPVDPYKADVADVVPPVSTTGSIVVPPQFDFASDRDVSLSIDVPEARGVTSYLSLCLEWDGDATVSPEIDYGSCVLRATMDDGRLDTVLTLAERHDEALAVVWFADPAVGPVYREVALGER